MKVFTYTSCRANLNVCKQWMMINCYCFIELFETILLCAKKCWTRARLKMLPRKYLQIIYIYIYIFIDININWQEITHNGWYAIKPNSYKIQSIPLHTQLYIFKWIFWFYYHRLLALWYDF